MQTVLKVLKADKVVSPTDNAKLLEVEFTLTCGEVTETRKQTFPLDTPVDTLKGELQKVVEVYNTEMEQKAASAVQDETEKKADETIAAVAGLEVTTEEVKPEVTPAAEQQTEQAEQPAQEAAAETPAV